MDKKFASRTDVAYVLGIDRRTFSSYCTGRRNVTNASTRKKLFDLTGIETFQSDTPDSQDSALLTIWADLYIESYSHRKNDNKHDNKDSNVAKNDDDVVVDDLKTSVEGTDVYADDHNDETVISPKKEDLTVVTEGKSSLGGIDRPSLNIAVDLRNWFNNQHTWKTQKEIADHVGASHSSMKRVFQGVKIPEGIVKQKLYELTQLECFRDDKQEKYIHVEEAKISICEDNIQIDDKNVCADKMGIPIYEVKTSIDKKNGHTKKMNIPIHEVKVHIVEVNEPITEIHEPVEEVNEPITEMHEPVEEVNEPIADIYEPVEEVNEPIADIYEPVEEVNEHITEIHEPVAKTQEQIADIHEPVAKAQESIADVQEQVYQVQLHIRKLATEKRGKNYHADDLRNLADYIEGLEQEVKLLKSSKKNGNKKGSGDDVDKLAGAFYSLAKILKQFKNCTSEQREKVKNSINAQDFGYVTSFMKAMYDEQSFADFIFFAEYEFKGDIK